MLLPQRIFVTGTDTDVGKTIISGVLVAGLQAHYWKPIQTGNNGAIDTHWITQHTDIPSYRIHPETYSLGEPLSPHAAADIENVEIDINHFQLPDIPDGESLIIEGAGGIMVPLNREHYMLDLIKSLAVPVLLVADSQLGTINHTLLSVIQLRRNHIPIIGVVMNGPRNQGNCKAIEFYGKVKVLAQVEPMVELNPASLTDCFKRCFMVPGSTPA